MSRELKPGDVALIEAGCHANRKVAIRTGTPSNMGWAYSDTHDGKSTQSWTADTHGTVSVIRPLVVIDPEDREQLERLVRTFYAERTADSDKNAMQTALRSLIEPPKPEEPTGLGAVVEDADGLRWVRRNAVHFVSDAPRLMNDARTYAEIDAVRVLSEGVQS